MDGNRKRNLNKGPNFSWRKHHPVENSIVQRIWQMSYVITRLLKWMCETGKKGSRMHRCVRGIMHLFKRCPRNTYSIKFLSTGICKTNVNMNRKENWLTLQMHHFYVQPKMCTASHPNHTNLPDMCWKCAGCSFVYMLLAFCAMFVPGSRSWSRDCTWGSAGTCFFLGIFKAYSHIIFYKELG